MERPTGTGDEPEPRQEATRSGDDPEYLAEPGPEGASPEEAAPEASTEAGRKPLEPRRMGWRDWALVLLVFLVGMLSARACRGG